MIFRMIFSYARWVYPKVEGPSLSQRGPKAHRFVLFAIVTSVLATIVWNIVAKLL
jgi:hypothetical protein